MNLAATSPTSSQIGVFAAYVSARGHAFIDRALYLPKSWTGDAARLAAAHVPEAAAFATKPALAVQMIRRALVANVPFSWVAADAVYGVGDVEQALPSRQRLCPWRSIRPSLWLLVGQTCGRRHRCADRTRPPTRCMAASVCWRGHQNVRLHN